MPVAALEGLTNSATDAFADAQASLRSAMSAAVYSTPPTRLEDSVASRALARRRRWSRCAGGQYPGDGRDHHCGSTNSLAAAAAFAAFASSLAFAFVAASERSGSTYAGSSAARPGAPRPDICPRPLAAAERRSVTQRPARIPGRLRRRRRRRTKATERSEAFLTPPPKPNTLVIAHAAANSAPQPGARRARAAARRHPAPARP